jgi:tetratricopeptide (TPR) repeat protein
MKLFIYFIGIILVPFNLSAQTEIRGGKIEAGSTYNPPKNTYAIIVGISNYPKLTPLKYADNDAILFREFLMSPAGGSTPLENIRIMLNEEATAPNFWLNGMSWLNSRNPSEGDRVYIFLAGHGDAINSSEYFFLTYDCQPGNDKNNYLITGNIQLYNLKSRIQGLTSRNVEVILIMDACRTGDIPGGNQGLSFFSQSVVEMHAGELILLSASPNQFAFEDASYGGGHGLFTYYLVRALAGEADEDDDQVVTLLELEDYVKRSVRTESRKKYNIPQVPQFCCSQFQQTQLSQIDVGFTNYMASMESIGNILDQTLAMASQKRHAISIDDPILAHYYHKFNEALAKQKFKGEESARHFFDLMVQRCPDCEVVNTAKTDLVVSYLNFGQAKINLYLSGKEHVFVHVSEVSIGNEQDLVNQRQQAIITIATAEYADAAGYMKQALLLLDNDPFFVDKYQSKIEFLEIYSERNTVKPSQSKYWLAKIDELTKKDTSAYMLNLAGLICSNLDLPDLSLEYYHEAIHRAPGWVYPVNNMGVSFSEKKEFAESEKYYLKAIETDSSFVAAYSNLGLLYKDQKQYIKAEEYYLKAIEIDSSYANSFNNLGILYADQKQYKIAEEYYFKAIETDSSYGHAYYNLGLLYKDQKQYIKAEEYYLKAIETDSSYVYAYNNLGSLYKDQKQYKKAEEYYLKAIEIDSSYVHAFNNLGGLYKDQKQYKKAEEYYLKAIEIDSSFVAAYSNLGLLYKDQKQYEKAEEYYLKAIETDSSYVYAYNNLGLLYADQKQYEKAEDRYLKAMEIDSSYVNAYHNLGNLYYDLNRYGEAIAMYDKAITLEPDNAYYYYKKGNYLFNLNRYEEALAMYDSAITLKPDNAEYYYNKGVVLNYLRRYVEAIAMYDKAITLKPDNASYYYNNGVVLNYLSRYEEAIAMYDKAIALKPEDARYYYNKGRALGSLNRYEEAIAMYDRAIALKPDYALAYNNKGSALRKLQRYDEAVAIYKYCIEIDPGGKDGYLYNIGCAYSLIGNTTQSLNYLEQALKSGYRDFEWIDNDTTWDNQRETKEFKLIIERYKKEPIKPKKP